jgi:hypothetical protein
LLVNQDQGATNIRNVHVTDLAETSCQETDVAAGHQKNFRLQVRCHRKGQPRVHAARKTLQGFIDEFFQLGEAYYSYLRVRRRLLNAAVRRLNALMTGRPATMGRARTARPAETIALLG